MTELPTRDDFHQQLNTKFNVFFDGENPTEIELTEVSEMRRKPQYEAFALAFQVPKTVPPHQGLFRVEHEALGTMDLFMVPFEENENGYGFEALFNKKL